MYTSLINDLQFPSFLPRTPHTYSNTFCTQIKSFPKRESFHFVFYQQGRCDVKPEHQKKFSAGQACHYLRLQHSIFVQGLSFVDIRIISNQWVLCV